jgi:ribosomal protein S18 acetylase RimI-like enzyme
MGDPTYTVRLGKPNQRDREVFIRLWRDYLLEHYALGGDIPVTEVNLLEFLRIYDSYSGGSLWGAALIAELGTEPVGVMLGGEVPGGFNIVSDKPGRLCTLLGVYVVPAHRRRGVAWLLQDFGNAEMLRQGFSRVQSMVLEGYPTGEANALGWGARKVASVIQHDLTEPHGRMAKLGRTKGEGENHG